MTPEQYEKRIARERRARHQAEALLEQKAAELFAANQELAKYADDLTEEIETSQAEALAAHSKAATLESQSHQFRRDLDAAQNAVFRAERRLWDAIEATPDGFALFDADDGLVAANSAYMTFLSYMAEEIVPGLSYPRIPERLVECGLLAPEAGAPDVWLAELLNWHRVRGNRPRVIRLAGDRWIQVSERLSQDGDLVSLLVDITKVKRKEAELNEAREAAEAANRAKSAFLANMSHEIRTPMNGVVGMADLLCETTLDDEQRQFAETIRSSAEALLVIINDVLDYSKIEAGKLDLYPEEFNLERAVHDVALLLQPKAREKGIDLLIDYDLFLPDSYIGDIGRIRQVLTNIVGNAVKFTSSGFVLIRVTGIETAPDCQEIHVAIEDSGIGIASEKLGHIFGEFNQVDDQANRKFEGTGLGLAICKRLVGMMGGEIWVESTVGKGSCFGFRIGLTVGKGINPVTEPALPAFRRALVVDDLEVNRVILERQLRLLGVAACTVPSAEDALRVLDAPDRGGVDLVLTDHQMPGLDGIALAQAIADRHAGLPVMLLTSQSAETRSLIDTGRLAGCLRKPILRKDLLDAISGANAAAQGKPTAAKPGPPIGETDRPLKILAAEDNRTNQMVLTKMVAGLGVELDIAQNGAEAIEKFSGGAYDIVFMDISMPGMDGIEATGRIRLFEAQCDRARTPIVALTAHAMAGDGERFLAAGMDHYLTKPLRRAAILKTLAASGLSGFVSPGVA